MFQNEVVASNAHIYIGNFEICNEYRVSQVVIGAFHPHKQHEERNLHTLKISRYI